MADAVSLHCPNCGAIADPDARRCPYCKARLATVSCPSCFALMFQGAAFCPKCGARNTRTEQKVEGARCPGCGKEMSAVEVGATAMLECPACDGVWMDATTFERLCADRESQAAALHRFAGKARRTPERVQYRRCVECGKMMNRVNFGRVSGTVVDACRGHGTYLDAGELHAIVEFVHGGGLDRARERQIQELKEEQKRLLDVEARAARDRGRADPHSSVGLRWDGPSVRSLLEMLREK
jgi:Zn-finger nucleic acid-binding protein/RNA polymerase subunit RPABC4/transcription elongation factor Spt4